MFLIRGCVVWWKHSSSATGSGEYSFCATVPPTVFTMAGAGTGFNHSNFRSSVRILRDDAIVRQLPVVDGMAPPGRA